MENKKITPVVHAAIAMIEKVAGVESVKILSDEMERLAPSEDAPAGRLGVFIEINDELSGKYKTFLAYSMCEDMLSYPTGMFVVQEFVNEVIYLRDPKELFKQQFIEPDPDYEFDALKDIDKEGNMSLSQHTGNTETRIDTLPGADDIKK